MPPTHIYSGPRRVRKASWTAAVVMFSYFWLNLKSKFLGQAYYDRRIVALHLRNAASGVGKQLGHGQGYVYAHDAPGGVARMPCLPPELDGARFFEPGDRGFERKVAERMAENDRLRRGDG